MHARPLLTIALLALAALCVAAAVAAPWLQGAATIAAALALRPAAPPPEPARPDGRIEYGVMWAFALHLAGTPQPAPAVALDYDEALLIALLGEVL